MSASEIQLPRKPYTLGRVVHILLLAAGICAVLLLIVGVSVVGLAVDVLVGQRVMLALLVVAPVASLGAAFFYERRLQREWAQEYRLEIAPQFLSAREAEALDESRREIVAAFEIERRRIERDLHDGAQQYLVAATMGVGEVALAVELAPENEVAQRIAPLVEAAQNNLEEALKQLRATVRGIHPKVLSDMGLEAAVRDLASTSALPVVVRVPHALPTIPEGVMAAAYFFVAEALTNAAKYAPGAKVSVLLAADRDLHVSVMDDGPGGVVLRPEGGLVGLRERLAAFGGTLIVTSPAGGPTQLAAQIPLLLEKGNFTRV